MRMQLIVAALFGLLFAPFPSTAQEGNSPCFPFADYNAWRAERGIEAPIPWFTCVEPSGSVSAKRQALLGMWSGVLRVKNGPRSGATQDIILVVSDVSGSTPAVLLSYGPSTAGEPANYILPAQADEEFRGDSTITIAWTWKEIGARIHFEFTLLKDNSTLSFVGQSHPRGIRYSGTLSRVIPVDQVGQAQ